MAPSNLLHPSDLASLYVDHHAWLKGWLRRRLGDGAAAADLAQDTFLSVLESGSSSRIREPRPFLATVAGRLLVTRHRRRVLESAYLEALASLPEEFAPSPEAVLMAVDTLKQIDALLDRLPARAREAFLLAHILELSYADIAQRLKVSASSVKQYLSRANREVLFALAVEGL